MAGKKTKKKILCIEDERFISELYERALTKAGYKVKIVSDGAKALKEAKTDNYDIILLDLMIPNMTGMEVLESLRDKKGKSKITGKIIVTTNLEQGDEGRAALEKQADGYIIKAEITPKELVEFLGQLKV